MLPTLVLRLMPYRTLRLFYRHANTAVPLAQTPLLGVSIRSA